MNKIINDTYEIKKLIGKGGMSNVYLAEHVRLHTFWAVKEVKKEQGVKFDFLAEANILKKLQHPMITKIIDILEDSDYIYIVEDYVEGITLSDYLEKVKRIDEKLGLQWFKDLCNVLSYLHNQKPNPIIYRDLKPSNLMLKADGSLVLIDFGIAREFKENSQGDTTYIGTKGYAAPEQFGNAQSDGRTDIYSLGVTMYHLLTGKSPYEPPYNFVPARNLNPSLSSGMEFILSKCVETEPEKRYQTSEELLVDLDNIFRFDEEWKRYKRKKRSRVILIAAMLVSSIAMMTAGWNMMASENENMYAQLMSKASETGISGTGEALEYIIKAQEIFPDRAESYQKYAYELYNSGRYDDCISYINEIIPSFPDDGQLLLTRASANFSIENYESAAEDFLAGGKNSELGIENWRDYAVCLGRMGNIEEAEKIIKRLEEEGMSSEETSYIRGEMLMAEKEYQKAEEIFLEILDTASDKSLIRRTYISLGGLYKKCAALSYYGASPIEDPALRSIETLNRAMAENNWKQDSVLWEMLGMANYDAYNIHKDERYLDDAASCFEKVLSLGMSKSYIYRNLYAVYYEMGDHQKAAEVLDSYEQAFPTDYMPSALRGILLISLENQKDQAVRDYRPAGREYEKAGTLIRSEDDMSYYQQLGGLINELKNKGWL